MTIERRNPRSVDIDLFPTERILKIINEEDATVAGVVAQAIPEIARTVDLAVEAIQRGGRVFYVGAGTSGRIAALDATECPPTFSAPPSWIQAVMAGGARAFGKPVEDAEDDAGKGAADLRAKRVASKDLVLGVAASGRTPYTCAALEYARGREARTVAVVSVPDSPLAAFADVVIHIPVGPEVIAGSTRMKAGTAQKLALNMISTTTMIRLGMTYSNWMINVSMTNAKLRDRGIRILQEVLDVNEEEARRLSEASGGQLKVAVIMGALGCTSAEAQQRLNSSNGKLRQVLGPG